MDQTPSTNKYQAETFESVARRIEAANNGDPGINLDRVPKATPVGPMLEKFETLKEQAELAYSGVQKALEANEAEYLVKRIGGKWTFLKDVERLCELIELVDVVQIGNLDQGKDRVALISAQFKSTVAPITKLSFVLRAFAKQHPARAGKVQSNMVELLKRLLKELGLLVKCVRSYTGDVRVLGGAPYGKEVHLMTTIKDCLDAWSEV